MDRKSLREFTHRADNYLSVKDSDYKQWIFRYTFLELEKDLGKQGDITTKSVFPESKQVKARIIAKSSGILCGVEEIKYFLMDGDKEFRPSLKGEIKVDFNKKDGDKIVSGDVLMELEGEVHDILAVERVTLNLLMRMSGVATFTSGIVGLVSEYDVLVTPTRKSLWGLLDKRAVLVGGGGSHRINLSDAILVKDTHMDLAGRSITKVLDNIASSGFDYRFIEVEVNTVSEAVEVSGALEKYISEKKIRSIGVLLMDNMGAQDVALALEKIKAAGLHENLLFEASGGVNRDNVVEYAKTGVDIISMGVLTSGVKSVDMSLKVG